MRLNCEWSVSTDEEQSRNKFNTSNAFVLETVEMNQRMPLTDYFLFCIIN